MSKKTSQLNHIAIICDGNRRWARKKGWKVFKGHEYAVDHVIEPLVDEAKVLGISHITFWIFSTENWKRSKIEVDYLMKLFRKFFDKHLERMGKKGIRFKMIGGIEKFDQDIQDRITNGIESTKHNSEITVTFAMNYGGRDELVRATKKLAQQVTDGSITVEDISSELISQTVDTAGSPDPDLIVRTGGEQRTSGFMLWQSEYAEYAFPDYHFPELTPEKLREIVGDFHTRQRRYGA